MTTSSKYIEHTHPLSTHSSHHTPYTYWYAETTRDTRYSANRGQNI